MANEIIDTLHPQDDLNTNLYPNIVGENIPAGAVTLDKLSQQVQNLLSSVTDAYEDEINHNLTTADRIFKIEGYAKLRVTCPGASEHNKYFKGTTLIEVISCDRSTSSSSGSKYITFKYRYMTGAGVYDSDPGGWSATQTVSLSGSGYGVPTASVVVTGVFKRIDSE